MKELLLVGLLSIGLLTQAQDKTVRALQAEARKTVRKDPTDTVQRMWKRGSLFNINLSQGSLTNWAAGGDEFALSVNTFLNLFLFCKKDKHSWDNTLDVNFGYVRTTSLGSRKNDDRLDILSKYGYSLTPKWNLSGLFNFRSQMLKGYTYPEGGRTFSSAFLSPAYLLLSGGVDFKPDNRLSAFISPVTTRWIIVKDDSLSFKGLYGVDPGRHATSEFGAFLTVTYQNNFNKAVTYKGRLDLFSNYKHRPQNVDLFLSNVLTAKISRILSASWNVDLIYDDDVRLFGKNANSPALQIKSLVGLGLQVRF